MMHAKPIAMSESDSYSLLIYKPWRHIVATRDKYEDKKLLPDSLFLLFIAFLFLFKPIDAAKGKYEGKHYILQCVDGSPAVCRFNNIYQFLVNGFEDL